MTPRHPDAKPVASMTLFCFLLHVFLYCFLHVRKVVVHNYIRWETR